MILNLIVIQEEMEEINKVSHKRIQKKRPHYKWLTDQQKCDLIFRSMYLNENIRFICKDLNINFLTGRNIVQKYKKTQKLDLQPYISAELDLGIKDKEEKSECKLGIVLIDENHMRLAPSRTYKKEDEIKLIWLHSYFMENSYI